MVITVRFNNGETYTGKYGTATYNSASGSMSHTALARQNGITIHDDYIRLIIFMSDTVPYPPFYINHETADYVEVMGYRYDMVDLHAIITAIDTEEALEHV